MDVPHVGKVQTEILVKALNGLVNTRTAQTNKTIFQNEFMVDES